MSEKQKDHTNPYGILALVLGFFGVMWWNKAKSHLIEFYFNHRLSIAAFLSASLVLAGNECYLWVRRKRVAHIAEKQITNGQGEVGSVFLGVSEKGERVFVTLSQRIVHTQVVGTTNAGKTESVVARFSTDDIEKGRGLIFIDGKADRSLLNKLYGYAVKAGRSKDFRLFSLSNIESSHTFNPLIGDNINLVSEKVFKSFEFENAHYESVQSEIFRNALYIFRGANEQPTFSKLAQAITDPATLSALADKGDDPTLTAWAERFLNSEKKEREKNTSGLLAKLNDFASGDTALLFNTTHPTIDIDQAMREGLIVYFQLPVLKYPSLGKAIAKMVLTDIQSSVSNRHDRGDKKHTFFSIYLDDFTEYMTDTFVSLLNKSRSANVAVLFAHQAVGDLEGLGQDVKNQILTNTNLKIFMRTNEPDSAEYFAKTIGTLQTKKLTSRQKKSILGSQDTGDVSSRDTEEFIFHPNVFKSELGLGEGIVLFPHKRGSKAEKVTFVRRPDVLTKALPVVVKGSPEMLKIEVKKAETGANDINSRLKAESPQPAPQEGAQ